jgi:hypothetical protein
MHSHRGSAGAFCIFKKKYILLHCIIKWRHMVKLLTDLESIFQGLPYKVLLDMVPLISKFVLGLHNFYFGAYLETQRQLTRKD